MEGVLDALVVVQAAALETVEEHLAKLLALKNATLVVKEVVTQVVLAVALTDVLPAVAVLDV